MESYVKDNNFPTTVEDENTTGGNRKLLLHTDLERRQEATGTESFRKVISGQSKETIGTQPTVTGPNCKGQVFPGKKYDVNNSLNLELKKDGAHYQEESQHEAGSCVVGLTSSTNLKQYPYNAGIVVNIRDMCGLQKPKLIGSTDSNNGQGVVVHYAVQLENSSLQRVVMWFSKNMEHEVPKELVKIDGKV